MLDHLQNSSAALFYCETVPMLLLCIDYYKQERGQGITIGDLSSHTPATLQGT